MRTRLAGFCLAAITALGIFISTTRGAPIYTTFGPGNSFDANNFVSFSSGSPNGLAGEFANSTTFELQSVSLAMDAVAAGATVTITIRSNSFNVPGVPLATFTSTAIPTEPGIVTFNSAAPFLFFAGSSYWVSATVSSGQINWFENDQGISGNTASHTGTDLLFSGWTSNGSGTALAFEVDSVPEPSVGALCALGVCALVIRRGNFRQRTTVQCGGCRTFS